MENKMRKVIVSSGDIEAWRGYFHCWAGTSEIPFAIIETEKGIIKRVAYENMQFAD